MNYNSPAVRNVRRTERRRAYILDSDTDTTPQSNGRCVSELLCKDDCNDTSHGKP